MPFNFRHHGPAIIENPQPEVDLSELEPLAENISATMKK